MSLEVRCDSFERLSGDKAEVSGARRRDGSLGLEGVAGLVNVDFLTPEPERGGFAGNIDALETEDALVEPASVFERFHGEDEMVNVIDHQHLDESRAAIRAGSRR